MSATKKELKQAELIKARQQRSAEAYRLLPQRSENPMYGQDEFNPNSYLEYLPGDPKLAEPLPQGRYIDPSIPSALNANRMRDVQEWRENPRKYVEDNAQLLNNEQSLLDRGKTMFARIFDYRDEADLQFFNVNLSAVESGWDGFLRHFIGGYDLLNIGFGGLISAMPGGLDTLSYEELSGGLDVGQVLSGEMEAGMAPSPGQIAIASVARESKRIREGQARLSDILLLNPATAPFILAGIAAEDSPLQQDDFDILNKEQREKAFGSGWEQWMSGVTDAGLMFADPLIGAGVVAKVARKGMLGVPGTAKYGAEASVGFREAAENIMPGSTKELDDLISYGQQQTAPPGSKMREAIEMGEVAPLPSPLRSPDLDMWAQPDPENMTTVEKLIRNIVRRDPETGEKVWSAKRIAAQPEFSARNITAPGVFADMLHGIDNPALVALMFEAVSGTPGSMQKLQNIKPAFAMQVFEIKRQHAQFLAFNEPQKAREAADTFSASIERLTEQRDNFAAQMAKMTDEANGRVVEEMFPEYLDVKKRFDTVEQSIRESEELYDIALGNRELDFLDPTSAFYTEDTALRIVDDIVAADDVVTKAMSKEIYAATIEAKMGIPVYNNAYSRMVVNSRERRGTAAYQYAEEGTSILPQKRLVEQNGVAVMKSDGWFSKSEFPNVGRIRRNARVWRWVGTETPVGYIGLKGTSTVGSEREFAAALDLDLFKGEGVVVTRKVTDAKGNNIVDPKTGQLKEETFTVGGRAKREELFQEFYAALNNPDVDSFKVLQDIEYKIMRQFADAYGVPMDKLEPILTKANRDRVANLETIRKHGYWVDPVTKTQHHTPYLQSQLANGTYMQNFHEIEKLLRREAQKDSGRSFVRSLDIPAHMAASGYNLFNNFWRPLTLMRLSYTQRNVFEGMLRAMAYSSSLAPLTWPLRATTNGVRNKIVARTAEKKVAKAQKAIDAGEYGTYLREYKEASVQYWTYRNAMEAAFEGDKEKMFYVFTKDAAGNPVTERYTASQYEKIVKREKARMDKAEAALEANEAAFTKSVSGTEFGKWREAELAEIETTLEGYTKFLDQLTEGVNELDLNGRMMSLERNPGMVEQFAAIAASKALLVQRQKMLKYDAPAALIDYQGLAGRQRRMGSGTSIGPDGNYYNDAFADPYEQITRGLLSADNTVKQQLSLDATVWGSLFRRQLIREHSPVAWVPGNKSAQQAWTQAMVDTIETASSSPLIRYLVKNNWDVESAYRWMMRDKEGRAYALHIARASGGDGVYLDDALEKISQNFGKQSIAEERALLKFVDEVETARGGKELVFDADLTRAYILDVTSKVQAQMMGHKVFYDLLERRVLQKGAMKQADRLAPPSTIQNALKPDDVDVALASLTDEQRNALGYLQGSEIIDMGIDSVMSAWSKFTTGMFRFLGTIPEDAVVRGPFYNMRYKATRNALIEQYWQSQGMTAKSVRKNAKGSANQNQGMTLSHSEFTIPASELSRITVASHRRALADTREWMYTIERRTKLGKYGEWIYPFISATQNATVVGGKLLYKEPWLAPFLIDLWRMPTRLGIEDENGNILLPMPFPWVRDFLKDNPDIPVLGGMLDSNDMLRIPKDGINVIMPETGFGIIPRPTPWVQVGASELMKANVFTPETPQLLRSALGDEEADRMYQVLKEYVFGEEGAMSAEFLSYDKLLPAYTQKAIQSGSIPILSRKDLSTQYGYQYALQWHTQMARYHAGERDTPPDEAEIGKRTTNMFWFNFLGNIGLPTPLTPYPIITRPIVDNPTTLLQDTLSKYKEIDPVNANLNFERNFGDWALQQAMTKVTRNVGGANPTAETVSDINTFDSLLRDAAPLVQGDLDVLGIIVNNRTSLVDYEQSAYQWQKANVIPGTNQEWREVQSPEFANAERQKIAGWTVYRQFMDQLDAQLASAGFKSYESAGADSFKAAKKRFLANMMENPDYAGWTVDYQYRGGARAQAAVRVLDLVTADPNFASEMVRANKGTLLGIMSEYVYYRRGIINYLQSTGKGIDHPDNIAVKSAWANMRQAWKEQDVRWSEIANVYLSADDNPANPGNFFGEPMPVPLGLEGGF
jgi:hypothetical protein